MTRIDTRAVLKPPVSTLAKLGSIAVHATELLSPDGHDFDRHALDGLLADPEVQDWLEAAGELAILPVTRNSKS